MKKDRKHLIYTEVKKTMTIQYIKSHGYRVTSHSDGTCTVFIILGDNSGDKVSYHVSSLKQARIAMGY